MLGLHLLPVSEAWGSSFIRACQPFIAVYVCLHQAELQFCRTNNGMAFRILFFARLGP